MEEVAGDWRSLNNEELHNLYASPHIIRAIKSSARHITCMIQMRNAYKIWPENLKERGCAEDVGVDGKIILE